MATDTAFTRLDVVEQHLRLLQQQREQYALRLRQHMEALKDREHRGAMMKEAASDLLHAWKPAVAISKALQPGKGVLPLLVQFVGMRGSLKRRILFTALSMAAPALIKHVDLKKVMNMVSGVFRPRHGTNGHGPHERVTEEDFSEPWQ